MRVLAVALAIPMVLVVWQWRSDRQTTQLLSPIASEVAGRDVEVRCQSLWASLIDIQARHGEVMFDANGVPEPSIFLTHSTCDQLQDFAGSRRHGELDCLRATDWSRHAPLEPGSDCYRRASTTVYAVLTLAHEAYHTAGETDEAVTNCFAIQSMAYTALRLGAEQQEAELIARAMNALEPFQAGGYGTDNCRPGTDLDLHPETPDFPTEHPIVAAQGNRGSRGGAPHG